MLPASSHLANDRPKHCKLPCNFLLLFIVSNWLLSVGGVFAPKKLLKCLPFSTPLLPNPGLPLTPDRQLRDEVLSEKPTKAGR